MVGQIVRISKWAKARLRHPLHLKSSTRRVSVGPQPVEETKMLTSLAPWIFWRSVKVAGDAVELGKGILDEDLLGNPPDGRSVGDVVVHASRHS